MEAAQLGGQGSILRLQRLDLVLNRDNTQLGLHEEVWTDRVITTTVQTSLVDPDSLNPGRDPDPHTAFQVGGGGVGGHQFYLLDLRLRLDPDHTRTFLILI
jgi:hypothetical protein